MGSRIEVLLFFSGSVISFIGICTKYGSSIGSGKIYQNKILIRDTASAINFQTQYYNVYTGFLYTKVVQEKCNELS